MGVIRRSMGLSVASKYTQFLLVLVSNMVIARLLTPAEIGVYAVAAVLAGIAQIFRDLGIGQYLICEPELDETKIRVAFTLMTAVSWSLGVALVLVAGLVAEFYEAPALREVLWIQALCFLIVPFGAINLTLLQRDFRFGARCVVDVSSNVAQLVVAIALATAGFGSMSLAWASVASAIITSIGAMLARRGQLAFWPTLRGARKVLSFGGYVTGAQVLGTLNRDIPELLIGKFMGIPSLAFFSKAMLPTSLFSRFIMGALNPVLLPAFSKKHREKDIEQPLLYGVACLTALVLPGLVLLACLSDWVVMVLFGPQWGQVSDPMRIFAAATAQWCLTALFSPLLVALGHPRAPLMVQAIVVPVRIALIVLALPYGLEAIAFAWLLSGLLASAIVFLQVNWLTDIDLGDVAKEIWPSLWLGCPIAAAIGLIILWLDPAVTVVNGVAVLLAAGISLCSLWLVGLAVLKHPLYQELTVVMRQMGRLAGLSPVT